MKRTALLLALLIASGKIRKFVINILLMIPAVAAVLWLPAQLLPWHSIK